MNTFTRVDISDCIATGFNGIAIGLRDISAGKDGIALGDNAIVSNIGGIALGNKAGQGIKMGKSCMVTSTRTTTYTGPELDLTQQPYTYVFDNTDHILLRDEKGVVTDLLEMILHLKEECEELRHNQVVIIEENMELATRIKNLEKD